MNFSISTPDGKPKPPTGNKRDLPHMQSSLSPQGFGLYNSTGDDGGGDAPLALALANSKPNPRNKQTFHYNEYLTASPSTSQKQQGSITSPTFGGDDGRGWRNPMGNENSASHNNFGRGGGGGSYLNATSAPSSDSSKVICNLPPPSSSLGMSPEQSPLYKKLGDRLGDPGNGRAIMGAATPTTTTMRSGRIIPGSVEMDRDRKKDRLIDSLSQSDMITCLPGFKKRPTQFPLPRKSWPPNDQVVHRIAQQELGPNMMDYPSAPAPSAERSPAVPSSSYSRQAPATLSSILNYPRDKFIHGDDGEVRKNVGGGGGEDEIGRYISSGRNPNSLVGGGNPIKDPNNNARSIPPCSPITRAKAAVGQAQDELVKMNSIVEEARDRQKPPGSWKNMGTPFFSGSEPILKSAERQQKIRYRMELERQILTSKMRKAEQERREREGTDHPLGPEYAHPALTYYNPPQKISGNNSGSTAPNPTVTAALTKYMKEKYSLGNPSAPESARSTGAAPCSPMMISPEMGYSNGGGAQAGRMGPPQQAKMEKVLGNSNQMKTRMQVEDQNQGSANRFPPQQQTPMQQQQALVPGNNRPFNPQQHQGPAQIAPHYGYPAGVQQPPSRPGYGYPVNMNPWQMYQHPAYAQYYGQLAGAANAPGAVHPQQALAAAQYYQQQNYSPPPMALPPPSSSTTMSALPPRPLGEQQLDRGYGGSGGSDPDHDDDGDFDFEALKEKAYKSQKIWQTSDELPDPGLRTAVYKAELRKQIDEDRRRKDEKIARERLEDERIERKIKEFQEEERSRMSVEEQTRAELEEYELQQNQTKTQQQQQQQNRRRKNEAFTISQNSGRPRQGGREVRRRHQRSGSRSMDQQTSRMGAGDFEESPMDQEAFNNHYNDYTMEDHNRHCSNNNEYFLPPPVDETPGGQQLVRKMSPPVPVVQRKLQDKSSEKFTDNRNMRGEAMPHNHHPSQIHSSPSQSFFHQLKERLKSEKDLVERRLQEKVVSTHKNLNLLKYSLNQD